MSNITFKEIGMPRLVSQSPRVKTEVQKLEVSVEISAANYAEIKAAAKAFLASKGKQMTDSLPGAVAQNNVLDVWYQEQLSNKR